MHKKIKQCLCILTLVLVLLLWYNIDVMRGKQ
nr:MAG TPA: hypothetical protein [Caudoviricetes sp.]